MPGRSVEPKTVVLVANCEEHVLAAEFNAPEEPSKND